MKTFLLIDAHAYIHRSYHALPPLTSPKGEPIGAIYGLASTLIKEIREHKPDYIAAAFDRPEPTFRKEMFEDYKAHRPPADEELVSQMTKAHELFQKFNIPIFERAGYEADDIIGTFVKKFDKEDINIIILTGDLDTLQLVSGERVVVQTPKRGAEMSFYNEAAVEERFGLPPEKLPDYKGLVGDPSDNIPGVNGIGPKTAAKLLQEYGSVENLFDKLPKTDPISKKLLPQKEQALFSKTLATIKTDVPIDVDLNDTAYEGVPTNSLLAYFKELGFESLAKRISGGEGTAEKENQIQFPKENDHIIFESLTPAYEETLSSPILKVAYDWKALIKDAGRAGMHVKQPIFDVMVAGWLIDPDGEDFSINAMTERFLEHGAGANGVLEKLFSFFSGKIREYGLSNVFENMEMPLIPILAEMEVAGIGIDNNKLISLKNEIDRETTKLVEEIYKEAGEPFNINSPQQVSRMLFEKLGLEPEKKRRTGMGHRRTSKDVLYSLKGEHKIVNLILQYRENTKIEASFVDPLMALIGKDGRIHTTFLQTGTSTGRLASEKPNLQNVPQESKWSLPLRRAFVPKNGFSFLSLDYSQLELRLLADVSADEKLRAAFIRGEDIHTATATNVFNVRKEDIDPSMRRLAKTLNFGVIYGMGARAFAEASGLTQEKAAGFIREYFHDFPAVSEWQERIVNEARTFGFIKNKNGRRRWFLGVLHNPERGDFERQAVNMPIQSLGADIIKLAMIASKNLIEERGLTKDAGLLLSIHDELLFEVRDDILMDILTPLTNVMEHAYPLSVPLTVEAKKGKDWGDMEHIREKE